METMNTRKDATIEATAKNNGGWKWKLYLILFILLFSMLGYGYIWYQKTNELRTEAEQTIENAHRFETLQSALSDERTRCEQFIAQQEGDFGSFEYCQKFLNWIQNNTAIE